MKHEWPSNYGSQKPETLKNVPNLLAKRFQRDQDCLSTKDWQSFCLQRRLRPHSSPLPEEMEYHTPL